MKTRRLGWRLTVLWVAARAVERGVAAGVVRGSRGEGR